MNNNLWYKNSIIYQLHVKSFFDSNNNGIGDFKGLSIKLDYLKSLGINTIWLLPFYPSPLKDDGYDISDYLNINPDYGNLSDFKLFLKEAHKRDIKVITELVINHTSDQHEWFKRARNSPKNSSNRNYYIWSDDNQKYKEARIIFKDFETSNWAWDSEAKQYYWHRFFSHQPDLNFDNPKVHREIFKVVDFWFKLGVDGMRLDAIPYLYNKDGTICENLPETHEFLKKLRNYIDKKYQDKMILAEANQWPEDIIKYFGNGDECNMAFNFPVMPRIFMSLKMEDRFPIIDIISQTPEIPKNCQWVIFLRNHDELTLEMVTDEERDYMYRVYAKDPKSRINLGIRRRLAPLVNGDINQIKILNSILFSLPGTPVIYYGDEIGMGDNYYLGDRNGVRTPMQWNSEKNSGFSKTDQRNLFLPVITDPQYHYESVNVENSYKNPDSLFWFFRQIISIRKRFKSLSIGRFKTVNSNNSKVLSFLRILDNETVLIIINLSKNIQSIELYLSEYNNYIPEEVFGKTIFPSIGKQPYKLTISGLSFYWLSLENKIEDKSEVIFISKNSDDFILFEKKLLENYLKKNFSKNNFTIKEVEIIERVNINQTNSILYFFKVYYNEDLPEFHLTIISKKLTSDLNYLYDIPKDTILVKVNETQIKEIYYEAFNNINIRKNIFKSILKHKNIKINQFNNSSIKDVVIKDLNSWLVQSSSNNYLANYNNKFFLKIYKNFEFTSRPEIELINFLSKKGFKNLPVIIDVIKYKYNDNLSEIGVIQEYIENEGDFEDKSIKEIKHFLGKIISGNQYINNLDINKIESYINYYYLELINILAERTAEMHILLSEDKKHPLFFPESFTFMYQRSIYQSLKSEIKKTTENISTLSDNLELKSMFKYFLDKGNILLNYMSKILDKPLDGLRIRNHGEFNLKQILFTGKDFIFVDFDGISVKPFSERKIKRSSLREISFLMNSFHTLVYSILINESKLNSLDLNFTYKCADIWYKKISKIFLDKYYEKIEKTQLIPKNMEDRELLLNTLLLNTFFSELNHQFNLSNKEIIIPLIGINNILGKIEELII
ncbi:MAG: maltose alpha-D-glucosyltransferase [Candidatus Sericytochromatia bacterium]